MATNPGSWSSSSARQPRTPTHDPSASGLSSSHGVSLGSSKLYYRASEGLNSKSENGTQSISTPQSSLSSSNTSSSPPYSHKFESAASGSPYPSLPPGSSFSTSQGPASLRGPFSSLSLEQAPASLPAKLISNGNTHSPVAYDLSHTSSETSTTAQNAVSGDDQSSTTFSYDLSSSNIILPRGTIRPATVHPAVSQTGARSASSPVLIATPPPRPASLSAAELAPKSEKSRKFKKTNVSSLPAAPPSSSIASVPVAEGNVQMAELITNRWPDALYQGWMKKRNKGKESTAKKRYLVIKTNCIEYYSDPTVRFLAQRLNSLFKPYLLTFLILRVLIPRELSNSMILPLVLTNVFASMLRRRFGNLWPNQNEISPAGMLYGVQSCLVLISKLLFEHVVLNCIFVSI